jgi:hypothetical protein
LNDYINGTNKEFNKVKKVEQKTTTKVEPKSAPVKVSPDSIMQDKYRKFELGLKKAHANVAEMDADIEKLKAFISENQGEEGAEKYIEKAQGRISRLESLKAMY